VGRPNLSRRAILGGFAATRGAASLAACGGTSATSTPQAAATSASGAATSVAPTVNAAVTSAAPTVNAVVSTVQSAATGAAPTVAAAATANATAVNSAATTVTGAATSAAPTVNAAATTAGSAVASGPYTGKKLNVAYVINGNLGDKSFFDSGQRGMDQLRYAMEDIRRGCDLGLRGILVADLGLLWLVQEARLSGQLPPNLVVKTSIQLAAPNPAAVRDTVRSAPGTVAALPVGFGRADGPTASTGGTTRTTGAAVLLGLPVGPVRPPVREAGA